MTPASRTRPAPFPARAALSRAERALSRWQEYAFTRALRAVDADRVAAEARHAPDGPLSGLLFSVKDLFPVAGVESCAGSLLLRGWVPDRDPPLVAALRAAGAVVLGKGVCAELGFGVRATENRLDGRVLHFADLAVSPGGSSGGDAVAVGAGIADFAVAGDYGGSVRWPAQAAGVLGLRLGVAHPFAGAAATRRIGLRPPGSTAPGDGQQSELETAGLMARSPAALRAVLAALAGGTQGGEASCRCGSWRSSRSAAADQAGDPGPGQTRNRRLLVSDGTEIAPVRPEVAAALSAARDAAEQAGYQLIPAPDGLREALRDAAAVYGALRALTDDHGGVRELAAGRQGLLCASTRAVLDQRSPRGGAPPDPAVMARLRGRAAEIRRTVRAALLTAGAGALLLPAAATGALGYDARVNVAGRLLDATDLMAHCRAVSLTGLPALSLPAGTQAAGTQAARPWLSVQLLGADRGEEQLCTVAADLAAAGFGAASHGAPA
jgi:amidase